MKSIMTDWHDLLVYISPIGKLSFIILFFIKTTLAVKFLVIGISIYYAYLEYRYLRENLITGRG